MNKKKRDDGDYVIVYIFFSSLVICYRGKSREKKMKTLDPFSELKWLIKRFCPLVFCSFLSNSHSHTIFVFFSLSSFQKGMTYGCWEFCAVVLFFAGFCFFGKTSFVFVFGGGGYQELLLPHEWIFSAAQHSQDGGIFLARDKILNVIYAE